MTDKEGTTLKVGDYVRIYGRHVTSNRPFRQGVVARLDYLSDTDDNVLVVGYDGGMPALLPSRNHALTILKKFELTEERMKLLDQVREIFDDMSEGIERI